MDKIYSRPRIRIFYSQKKVISKKIAIILIVLTGTFTVGLSLKSVNPIFEDLCRDKAMEISTNILNEELANVLKEYSYKDAVTVIKTDENNILKTDVEVINSISSDLGSKITNRLRQVENEKIKIPAGAILGNKYLSGFGPGINIFIMPSGTVATEIKTEFKAQGINQTVYRIYLEIVCNEKILTSYKTIDTQIVNQVLLVETVIVGNVPEAYYNLEGIGEDNSIDIIE